jgi:hypothetical protein
MSEKVLLLINLYLLGDLNVDVSGVTLYNSLGADANLLMLFVGQTG